MASPQDKEQTLINEINKYMTLIDEKLSIVETSENIHSLTNDLIPLQRSLTALIDEVALLENISPALDNILRLALVSEKSLEERIKASVNRINELKSAEAASSAASAPEAKRRAVAPAAAAAAAPAAAAARAPAPARAAAAAAPVPAPAPAPAAAPAAAAAGPRSSVALDRFKSITAPPKRIIQNSDSNIWRFINGNHLRTTFNIPNKIENDIGLYFTSSTNKMESTQLERYGVIIESIQLEASARAVASARAQDTKDKDLQSRWGSTPLGPRLSGIITATGATLAANTSTPVSAARSAGGLYFQLRIVDLLNRHSSTTPALSRIISPLQPTPAAVAAAAAASVAAAHSTTVITRTDHLPIVTDITQLHISFHDYNNLPNATSTQMHNQCHIKFNLGGNEYNYMLKFSLNRYNNNIFKIKMVCYIRPGESTEVQLNTSQLAERIANDIVNYHHASSPIIEEQRTTHIRGIRLAFMYFFDDFINYLSWLREEQIPNPISNNTYIYPPDQEMGIVATNINTLVAYQKYLKYKTKYLELLQKINKN